MRCSSTKKVVFIGAFWALFFSSQNVWCVGDDFQAIRARVLGSQDLTELIESITTEDGLDINRLEVEDLLHAAVLRGHAAMVEGLAALGMDVDRLNYEGFAPLHYAAQRGDRDTVRRLLEAGANVHVRTQAGVYGNTPIGRTPWQLAEGDSQEDVRLLLESHGAEREELEFIPAPVPARPERWGYADPSSPEGMALRSSVSFGPCLLGLF